jgi:hypothetical protein
MNALVDDAELHAPHVERADSVDARRGEGRAVVGPDGIGQPDLLKEAAEDRLDADSLDRGQPVAREQRPPEMVADRVAAYYRTSRSPPTPRLFP